LIDGIENRLSNGAVFFVYQEEQRFLKSRNNIELSKWSLEINNQKFAQRIRLLLG
jgi:hypothetical protein